MEKLFSIKKAAEITGLTAETLRHYDRIGLVKPAAVSPDTKYRYYTQKEVIRLNTVHALRCMDFRSNAYARCSAARISARLWQC